MTGEHGFLKLIPAQPGWRVVELWCDEPQAPEIRTVQIVAWAEIEDGPGQLVPVCDDGGGFSPVFVEKGSIYFAVLGPGEEIDFDADDRGWRGRLATWRAARLSGEQGQGAT